MQPNLSLYRPIREGEVIPECAIIDHRCHGKDAPPIWVRIPTAYVGDAYSVRADWVGVIMVPRSRRPLYGVSPRGAQRMHDAAIRLRPNT